MEEEGDEWRTKFLSEWNADEADRGSVTSSKCEKPTGEGGGGGDGEKPEWDASTTAERKRSVVPEAALAAAKELLESNPGLKAKHSARAAPPPHRRRTAACYCSPPAPLGRRRARVAMRTPAA